MTGVQRAATARARSRSSLNITLGGRTFSVSEPERLCKELLERSLERGLGSLGKRDSEVLLLHLFLRHAKAWQTPLHELSLLLRIPEARLANHMYEMRLKFPEENSAFIRDYLAAMFARVKFECAERRGQKIITISIEDKFVRQTILADLRAMGKFGDGSFVKDILKVEAGALTEVFLKYLDAPSQLALAAEISSIAKEPEVSQPAMLEKLVENFLTAAASRAGEVVVDVTAATVTGGGSVLTSLGSALDKFSRKP